MLDKYNNNSSTSKQNNLNHNWHGHQGFRFFLKKTIIEHIFVKVDQVE